MPSPPRTARRATVTSRAARSTRRASPADGNRTFELLPETIQGGALLLHGLTDAPYSVRPIAETLRRLGYYALAPRMPGHGTAPAGLASAEWSDWMSVVRLAARHVRSRTGEGKPFVLVGYSNGGALAVKYAQDVLEGSGLPRPDRIVLLSPMIGVTPFAGFARVASLLHAIPFFEKNAWLDVLPEYNPYKYSSFPANAGAPDLEAHEGAERADRAPRGGRPAEGPRARPHVPVARRRDGVDVCDRRIGSTTGSPRTGASSCSSTSTASATSRPSSSGPSRSSSSTSRRARTSATASRRSRTRGSTRGTSLRGPRGPGPSSSEGGARPRVAGGRLLALARRDPVPGERRPLRPAARNRRPRSASGSGAWSPRGERSVLTVPFDQWMRLSWNPFFPYLEERVAAWAAISSSAR